MVSLILGSSPRASSFFSSSPPSLSVEMAGQPVELVLSGRAPNGGDNHVVDGMALVGKDDSGTACLAGSQDRHRRGQPVDQRRFALGALQFQRSRVVSITQVDQVDDQALLSGGAGK